MSEVAGQVLQRSFPNWRKDIGGDFIILVAIVSPHLSLTIYGLNKLTLEELLLGKHGQSYLFVLDETNTWLSCVISNVTIWPSYCKILQCYTKLQNHKKIRIFTSLCKKIHIYFVESWWRLGLLADVVCMLEMLLRRELTYVNAKA